MSTFIDATESLHLTPIKFQWKEEYFPHLLSIENNLVSKADAMLAITFLSEGSKLIVNAMKLLQMGYVDCAYYSLRQSLEISMAMLYLVDRDNAECESALKKWRTQEWFPGDTQIRSELKKDGRNYKEIHHLLSDFFNEVKRTKSFLNKQVHKQGFSTFYVSRRKSQFLSTFNENTLIQEFKKHLDICVGSLAVMRLAIDPFPVLLMDPDIYLKTGDILSNPYSDELVNKFIGQENITKYKQSSLYKEYYEYLIAQEKQSDCVSAVIKLNYIDTTKIDEILKQQHLLSSWDVIALDIFKHFPTTTRISCTVGLVQYSSDRSPPSLSSIPIREILSKGTNPPCNIKVGDLYFTFIAHSNIDHIMEHTDILDTVAIRAFNDKHTI